VDGDDLYKIRVAFQANDLFIALGTALTDFGLQPTDQGLLTVKRATGGLKQLCQMQEVGQLALTIEIVEPGGS
jgi:hypothetical protein